MTLRNFLTADHGMTNFRDTARALVAEYGARSVWSTTATATSSTTSVGMGSVPLHGATRCQITRCLEFQYHLLQAIS